MSIRFRKSFKVVPGIRLNIGKKGISSVSVGIPGTGLSMSQGFGSSAKSNQISVEERKLIREQVKEEKEALRLEKISKISLGLNDDGSIFILDRDDELVLKKDLKLVWDNWELEIQNWVSEEILEINGEVELLENIYQDIPKVDSLFKYKAKEYTKEKPEKPIVKSEPKKDYLANLGFFAKFFNSKKEAHVRKISKINRNYTKKLESWELDKTKSFKQYLQRSSQWELDKEQYDLTEASYEKNFYNLVRADTSFMEKMLSDLFNTLIWPRETLISYQVEIPNTTVWIDIDLPEIEDLPQKIASVSASGKKVNIKNKSQRQLREEYAKHIHGIVFRLVNHIFHVLPDARNIFISGYSQRLDTSIAKIKDDYLLSYKIDKETFNKINFKNLEALDPIRALDQFEHIKKMSKTYLFKEIEPFGSKK